MRQVNELPSAFQTDILQRFLDEKTLRDIADQYKIARFKKTRDAWSPTSDDIKVYHRWMSGERVSNLAKEMKVTRGTLDMHLSVIARMAATGELSL